MQTLTNLNIRYSYSDAKDNDFVNIGNLTSLTTLDMCDMAELTDASLAVIGKLVQLRMLSIARCSFTDAGLPHLSKLPRLQALEYIVEEGGTITREGLELNDLSKLIVDEIVDEI
jgi:hypothetical protein